MEKYLKGKNKIEQSCNHLQSIQRSLRVDNPLPDRQKNRVQVSGSAGEPIVECITRDGKITRILITCKCGEQIELTCHYT
jgi:hypothetical protein